MKPHTQKNAPSQPYRVAWTADLEGHKVKIWLFENGVYLAKKGQKPAQGLTNYGQTLEDLIKVAWKSKPALSALKHGA